MVRSQQRCKDCDEGIAVVSKIPFGLAKEFGIGGFG